MRRKRIAAFLILMMVLVTQTAGCGSAGSLFGGSSDASSDMAGTGYNIYYIGSGGTEIKAVAYQFTSTTEDGIIEECLTALRSDPEDENYSAVIGDRVNLEKYIYDRDSRILSLYLSGSYNDLPYTSQVLVQAAIVMSMTQFSGIVDYVAFCVGDEWVTDEDGSTLLMKYTDYETDLNSNPENLTEMTTGLYFASKDGTGLVRSEVTLRYSTSSSRASVVLDCLIRGKDTDEYSAVLSENTLVRSIYVEDGVCQVDFNRGFLETPDGQDRSLKIEAVTCSLTELEDIDDVRITVDGQAVEEFTDDQKEEETEQAVN